jgi:hypothetical protein
MKQLYFCEEIDDEFAFHLAIKDMARYERLEEITLTKAIPSKSNEYFHCRKYHEVGEKSQSNCGRFCDGYTPKNGKAGMCRHQTKCYEPTGEPITIKIK